MQDSEALEEMASGQTASGRLPKTGGFLGTAVAYAAGAVFLGIGCYCLFIPKCKMAGKHGKKKKPYKKRKNNSCIQRLGMVCMLAGAALITASLFSNIFQWMEKEKLLREFENEKEFSGSVIMDQGERTTPLPEVSNPDKAPEEVEPPFVDNPEEISEAKPIGILRIPGIDSVEPVLSGSSGKVLARALGHMEGTAWPGETGNCVIAGHRNYSFGKLFNRLNEVKTGDEIYLDTLEETYHYVVTQIRIVEPDAVEILDPTDREQLTLFTCTPIYLATHRLVIIADRIR